MGQKRMSSSAFAASMPLVKICCIMTRSELRTVLDNGVVFIGFVSQMPSGQGMITNERIKELVSYSPSNVNTFLLTSHSDPAKIADQWEYCRTRTMQLCRPMKVEQIAHLKNLVPQAGIVGVVHVKNAEAIEKALELSEICDEILLDSGDPKSRIPKLGGTGKPHDWLISKSIKTKLSKRVWLAGGLNSENVICALDTVGPDGVDVCSGVRTSGSLDVGKLRAFLDAIAIWSGTEKIK
jgi:phosphoribosylanthranilate isomerase